jgi:two-component system OmpR family response regulator
MNVFLVEDSALLRERLAALLASIPGARLVGHAATSEAALRGIREAAPDVVVCDIQLEQGSGFDVLRGVKAANPAVDVYMLTNFASESYRQAALRYGARGFFDKSTQFEALKEALQARGR